MSVLTATVASVTDAAVPELVFTGLDPDPQRDVVYKAFFEADPRGDRAAKIFRETFDQLYDGQRTGRFRWEQLFKTEKTHFGTLLEINLRRAFDDVIDDGHHLDYRVSGEDIDCKYSQKSGGWMLPPECFGHLLLVATANDERGTWSLGIVRATDANRRTSKNRDGKTSLGPRGQSQIAWLHKDAPLPPNVLLGIDATTLNAILSAPGKGQGRVNELFRRVTNTRIGRNTIATLAQQSDYMARVRDNGHGARTVLREEGYLIPGDYDPHRQVAKALGAEQPDRGEVVSLRVVPAAPDDSWSVELDGRRWRLAQPGEAVVEPAPRLPSTKKPVTS